MTHRSAARSVIAILGLSTLISGTACKPKSGTVPVTPIPTIGCQPWDCGSLPEGQTTMCLDGETEAGPTGRCIAHGTECAWEVVSCPETPECEVEECGTRPSDPAYLCTDNQTIAGPTGRCIGHTPSCAWERVACPPGKDLCPVAECGEPLQMMNWVCGDGVTVGGPSGDCVEQVNGVCAWEIVKCPVL